MAPLPFRPAALAACLATALLLGAAPARSAPPQAPEAAEKPGPDWSAVCPRKGPDGFCTITATPAYGDNRGGRERVTVSLRRDAQCTSLHVGFDRAIDLSRPVLMRVDDGPVQAFYTPKQLNDLADAVDAGQRANLGEPGFAAFLTEIAAGQVAAGEPAAAEMLARFARIKESRRLGVACEAMARLLPQLRAGSLLRLSFHVVTPSEPEPYHWPALGRREVVVPLQSLAPILDSLPPTH